MEKIKVLLVDDHQIVRDGIKALLSGVNDIEIVGEASDGNEALIKTEKLYPHIIIMDISMPEMSGIEVTKAITQNYPQIKVLILSMFTEEDFILNAIEAGIKGYLPKNTTREELLKAIRTINSGKEYYGDLISQIILKSYINNAQKKKLPEEKDINCLSSREVEILKLIVEGLNNQEIADKLFISIRTVESHKSHIMQKLELKTTVDMVKFAIKNKLVSL
ncbi:MAG: hypothetical protein AUJ97_07690 [Bacteroidetes bacterium CG2_30_32_10]|nr:MAG: hypothetical protein AUJ97_07690 [Bacteroidetes bacterium CG2_30_32_10]